MSPVDLTKKTTTKQKHVTSGAIHIALHFTWPVQLKSFLASLSGVAGAFQHTPRLRNYRIGLVELSRLE